VPEEENNKTEEQAPEEQPEEGAPEAPAEEAPAEEAAAEEPVKELSPKERRRLERSRHTAESRQQRSPEERAAERSELRRQRAEGRRRYRVRSRERRKGASPVTEPQPPVERARAKPRVRQGVVVSDKADKTITVRIDMQRPHRTYGKIVRTSSTLHAHDEQNEAHAGDTVRVVESRPLSATKRWRLVEILERAR
jgi:small subunit ribosomal protein S17